jgi:hypothetical protein
VKPLVRVHVMRHFDVCSSPYDVFSAVVEARRWGFGFRIHDWRDRWPAPHEWGLRIQFWRWHVCFGLNRANKGLGGKTAIDTKTEAANG